MYKEALKEMRKENIGRIKIGGIFVQMPHKNEDDLYNMLKKQNTLKKYHVKINQQKTKVLICSKHQINANIFLDGKMLETVQNLITWELKLQATEIAIDIISRIAQPKQPIIKKETFYHKYN